MAKLTNDLGRSHIAETALNTLVREGIILRRLVYKNKNQHRRDRNFQKINALSKSLQRLASHEEQLKKTLCPDKKHITSAPPRSQAGAEHGPSLQECIGLLNQVVEQCEECFRGCQQQLAMSVFIPFNLLVASLLSRARCLADAVARVGRERDSAESRVPAQPRLDAGRASLAPAQPTAPAGSWSRSGQDLGEPVEMSREELLGRLQASMRPAPVPTRPQEEEQPQPATKSRLLSTKSRLLSTKSRPLSTKSRPRPLRPNLLKVYSAARREGWVLRWGPRHPRRKLSQAGGGGPGTARQ